MSDYKYIRVEINKEQPLDDLLRELERLGYKPLNKFAIKPNYHLWLVADCDGFILGWRNALILGDSYYKTTTLAEIKEMKMAKSFEQVLNQEKNELTEAFLVFGEGKRVNKTLAILEMNRPDFYKFYEAGKQSRQAEIDELQKRIDDAVALLEYNEYVDSPLQALEVLKGDTND